MTTISADSKLEYELQELYILCTHWLQDISFMEDETRFFKNIINKYQDTGQLESKSAAFKLKITEQQNRLEILKTKIPEFLDFLKPFIGDLKKEIDLSFLQKYNALEAELQHLFAAVKNTKKELFSYTESIMGLEKTN
ncbi:MAG: hypothetical protein ACXVJD_03235 [Mucilaginibacter sp.]